MFTETIWRVQPINASWHPAILTKCMLCNTNGTQTAPFEKFFHAGKHVRGTVALGMEWARTFKLIHHPTCRGISAQYAAVEAAEAQLAAPQRLIYLLEQALSQAERELDRAYSSKLPPAQLSQIAKIVEAARTDLAQGRTRFAPEIARIEANVAVTKTALENARAESVPESTLAEFEKAMAKYLPLTDAQPEAPGQQRKAPPNILHV